MKSSTTISLLLIALAAGLFMYTGLAAAGGPGPAPNPDSMLSGSYSGIFSGYLVTQSGNQPLAGTGLFISDGKGNISGHEVFNLNGNACPYQLKGTYTLQADGTGTNNIDFINGIGDCPNGNFTQSIAVVDGGDLILLSNTNSPDVVTEHWYRVQNGTTTGACCIAPGVCFDSNPSQCGGHFIGGTSCAVVRPHCP